MNMGHQNVSYPELVSALSSESKIMILRLKTPKQFLNPHIEPKNSPLEFNKSKTTQKLS